jgi:hypothetical protein
MIDMIIEKEILHIHNTKINTLRKKKYAWLYIILLLSIVVKIEAGKSFYIPVQEHLRTFATATNLALKKIQLPSCINQLPAFRLMQDHPKISIFSIFGTALTGILLHRSHIKISTSFLQLHDSVKAGLLTSLQKIYQQKEYFTCFLYKNNSVKKSSPDKQELKDARRQLHIAQEELTSATAKKASLHAEYGELQQEITQLRKLYEETSHGGVTHNQDFIGILTNVMESFSSARDLYTKESQQFVEQAKAWSAEKALLMEQCKNLKTKLATLDGLYKEQCLQRQELESKKAEHEAELNALKIRGLYQSSPLTKSDGTDIVAASRVKAENLTPLVNPQPLRTSSHTQDPVQKRSHTDGPEHRSPPPTRKIDLKYGKIIEEAQDPQTFPYHAMPRTAEDIFRLWHDQQ